MKDSFVFYKSWIKAIRRLESSDSQMKVINAICDFTFDDTNFNESDFTNIELVALDTILPLIETAKKHYENGLKGKEFGKLGGRPKKAETPIETPTQSPNDNDNVNVNDIIRSWNDLIGVGITPIKSIGHTRKNHLRARLREYGSESIYDIIDRIRESDFLQGKHKGKPWVCTFDWVILPNNYPKVLEGNYANKSVTKEDKISDIDEYIARRAGVIT